MKGKKFLIIVISFLMILTTILPIFAEAYTYIEYIKYPPSDLGVTNYDDTQMTGYRKYYVKIYTGINFEKSFVFRTETNNGIANSFAVNMYISNNTFTISNNYQYNEGDLQYFSVVVPEYSITIDSEYYYIPIYCCNCSLRLQNNTDYITCFLSSTTNETTIQVESYNVGYANGYNEGYAAGIPAGAGMLEDLNFVENIEMLIGKFTGDDYAQYITPIAIVLAILLVYFIFIRFLLSLIKAKGVIKVCDIVTLVACISILVVMYLPMIDFTITQHQLVEQVYSVAADVTP